MNKIKWIVLIILACCIMAPVAVAQEPDKTQAEPRKIEHIVIIAIDELNSKIMNSASAPNLRGLAAQGVVSTAVSVLPSNYPNYVASLLTGADPSIHGFTGSDSKLKTNTLPDIAVRYGKSAVFVAPVDDMPKGLFTGSGQMKVESHLVDSYDNEAVITKAIQVWEKNSPYLMGIKLSLKKGSGKTVKSFAGELTRTDNEIGRFFQTLHASNVFNNTLIVITGNYNIEGNGAALTESELMVPVVMAGPGVKVSASIPPVRIIDIAPTIAQLSGMHLSPESNGFVLWNAMNAGNSFAEENLLLNRVKDLSNENVDSKKWIYRLQEEKRLVKAEKEQVDREKQLIQKVIQGKDKEISDLKLKIGVHRFVGIILTGLFIFGYILEYFLLKKKFLMFS